MISLVSLLLLTAAIPFSLYLVNQQQDIRSRAQETAKENAPEQESLVDLTNQLLRAPKEPDISAKDTDAQLQKLKEIAQRRKEIMLKTAEEDPELFLKYILPEKIKDSFPKEMQEFIEEEKEVRGELTVYHLDDFQGGKSKYKYKLKEERTGNKYELHFAKPPGGLLSESQVVVKGVSIDSKLVIDSVRFAGDPRGRETHGLSIESSPSLESTGEKRILVLLVNFESDRREPVSIEYVRSLFAPDGLMNTFYKESSFNQLSLSADVYGWYTISDSNIEQGTNEEDCAAAADSRATSQGIEVNEYEHIIYVFPSDQPCLGYGYAAGVATIGGDPTRSWIFYPIPRTFLHEFGHNLGLGHARALYCGQRQIDRFPNCDIFEYGDPSDVMGTGMNRINAPNRSVLGWLRPEEILSVPEEGGRYTISSLDASSSGIKVLRIEKPTFTQPWEGGRDYYYVSYRQATGHDISLPGSFTNGSSLHIRHEDIYQGLPSLLLDSAPGGYKDMTDAGLTDGSVFSDLDGISITQESHSPSSATLSVQINPDSYACRRGNPIMWILPEDYGAVAAPGTPLRYRVSIKNEDKGRCPETRFALSPRFPPGNWDATFETNPLSVPPEDVRSTDLVVSSPADVQDGMHIFSIRGTSESDPTLWVESVANYIVFSRERTSLNVSVKIPGIGSGQRENPNPTRRERSAEVWLALNELQARGGGYVPLYRQVDLIFDGNTFTGSLDLADIQSGSYLVRVKLDNTLVKSIADVSITGGTSNDLSMVTLVSGDLNNDNRINIQDFSILISCFGSRQCRPEIRKTLSDFNGDGRISGIDYSRLITNFFQRGE